MAECLPERRSPELTYLETKFAALVSYGLTLELLQEVLPIGQHLSSRTIRRQVRRVAGRLAQSPPGCENLRQRILRQVALLDSSGEVVGPVRNGVAMEQGRDVSQICIGHGGARLAQRLDDSGHLERVPNQNGVGDQAQAARLIHDLRVIAGAEFPLVSEKDPTRQAVPMLAPV